MKNVKHFSLLFVALGFGPATPSFAAAPASRVAPTQAQILISATVRGSSPAPICQKSFQVAQERGTVCRNGSYTCSGIGSGTIGYSCGDIRGQPLRAFSAAEMEKSLETVAWRQRAVASQSLPLRDRPRRLDQ